MKKNSGVKDTNGLQKRIRKIRSKYHCKSSRNEQVVLYELTMFFDCSKNTKTRKRRFSFPFYKEIKFITRLLKKLIGGKLFSL